MTVTIDMPMPEACNDCMFKQAYEISRFEDGKRCMLTGGAIQHVLERVWWCPLKEVSKTVEA
ncbi:hypothetical protein [Raoultibacter timonensis]|uniref:hypothetical protein n=1 Tax=Raoultibacter timonensis TaxID=1907662 RepID=UPI0026DB0340|nr:hypothetical protein [Raoultibacter timonensis]